MSNYYNISIRFNKKLLGILDLLLKDKSLREKFDIPYFKNRSQFLRFLIDLKIKKEELNKND